MKNPKGVQESSALNSNAILSTMLSHEMGLYIKTRKLQWNELGDDFPYLHKLFHSLYMAIENTIESVSDRINLLGGNASNAIKESTELSRRSSLYKHSQKVMMNELVVEQEATTIKFKKEIEADNINTDTIANDFLLDIMEQRKTTNSILRNISRTISSELDTTQGRNP